MSHRWILGKKMLFSRGNERRLYGYYQPSLALVYCVCTTLRPIIFQDLVFATVYRAGHKEAAAKCSRAVTAA